jgi:sterol desaturase/sphingolipid hydroxylase (fatty acid hydroxylase superfamily)
MQPPFLPQPDPPRKRFRLGRALLLFLSGVRGFLIWTIGVCLLGAAAIVAWRFLYLAWKASGRARDYIDHNI